MAAGDVEPRPGRVYHCDICHLDLTIHGDQMILAPLVPDTEKDSSPKRDAVKERPHVTRYPARPAPNLRCPECDRPLEYLDSVFGGVPSAPDRWDRFACRDHGVFDYRHRTRKLRPVMAI